METILLWIFAAAAIAIVSMLVLLIASEREVKRKRLETDSLKAQLQSARAVIEGRPNLLVNEGTAISSELVTLTEQVRDNEVAITALQCEIEALRAENNWLKQQTGAFQLKNPQSKPFRPERIPPQPDEQFSARDADFHLDLGRRKSRLIFPATAAALLLIALVSIFFVRGRTGSAIRQANSAPDSQLNLASVSDVTSAADSADLKPDRELAPKTLESKKHTGATAGASYEVVRSTRLFSEPNESSRPLARIEAGMEINVVGERDEWLEVRSRHGRPPGFIRKETAVQKGLRR